MSWSILKYSTKLNCFLGWSCHFMHCFRSAFLTRLLQFVKEMLGWRPGCIETEREREQRENKRWGGERGREGPGGVYISCLLTWLCGQAANRTQGKEQVVLFLWLLLWLWFGKRLPPLLFLSIHLSSLALSLSLSRPEQSRVQCFPLLTHTSTTRACHYLSLKLQTSFFLLVHFYFSRPMLQKRFKKEPCAS